MALDDTLRQRWTASTGGLRIITLLREREILDRVQRSFREHQLPEEIFYWFPSSVKAWVDLCSSSEYRNANRSLEVLKAAGPQIGTLIQNARVVCGLGCGEGSKDTILIQGLKGRPIGLSRYVGADFSQALLELAMEQVGQFLPDICGIKCDLGYESHLKDACVMALDKDGSPVIFTILGNTLGAFGAQEFPRRLREHLRREDRLLFDGEIYNEATLAGYDNPTNRRFAWGPLNGVGITEADGKLEFASGPAGNGLFAVTKHFTARRSLRIYLGGEAIEIRAGAKLRMSSSIKYADESALLGAVEGARFRIEGRWKSADGNFVLACARLG